MAAIRLINLVQMQEFGNLLASVLVRNCMNGIFLSGSLGSGKTTLARSIVEALPGAENCEFSSPSFTIYNHYPTLPPILHCDLYKCHANLPEEVIDCWHNQNEILILEWAEYFPLRYRMGKILDISFNRTNETVDLTIPHYNDFIFALPGDIRVNFLDKAQDYLQNLD